MIKSMKLICPVCGMPLIRKNAQAVCENRHSFDYARSGYLNLNMKKSAGSGDDAEMVRARTGFLSCGAYAFLKDTLAALTSGYLADLGCGEGYYTSALPAEEKYGFDLSRHALSHAAKHDPSTSYVLASIFRLPLAEESMDTALTCFAPPAFAEVKRILKPGGRFIFVVPAPEHLIELKTVLYETPYLNPVKQYDPGMRLIETKNVSALFKADQEILMNLFHMTPYAWRTGESGVKKLSEVSSLDITASFTIHIWQKDG